MYRVYMGEFKIAMKTLSTYEKESNEFKEVLEVLQQGPLCEHLSLASYLLTPVQRLPRYELLLKVRLLFSQLDLCNAMVCAYLAGKSCLEYFLLSLKNKTKRKVISNGSKTSPPVVWVDLCLNTSMLSSLFLLCFFSCPLTGTPEAHSSQSPRQRVCGGSSGESPRRAGEAQPVHQVLPAGLLRQRSVCQGKVQPEHQQLDQEGQTEEQQEGKTDSNYAEEVGSAMCA